MATPIDLSAFKLVAGEPLAAAKVTNMMTAVETWSGASIDPAAMLQKGAAIGQQMVWNGTLWAPGDGRYPVGPTMVMGALASGGGAGLLANAAQLVPIPNLVAPTTLSRIGFYITSGGLTGNTDVGIYYSDDDVTFTRLVSKGSTATPNTGAQSFSFTPTVLTPVAGRRWYLAIGCSSGTPQFVQASVTLIVNTFGKTASFPLPSSLTGVASGSAVLQPYLYATV